MTLWFFFLFFSTIIMKMVKKKKIDDRQSLPSASFIRLSVACTFFSSLSLHWKENPNNKSYIFFFVRVQAKCSLPFSFMVSLDYNQPKNVLLRTFANEFTSIWRTFFLLFHKFNIHFIRGICQSRWFHANNKYWHCRSKSIPLTFWAIFTE